MKEHIIILATLALIIYKVVKSNQSKITRSKSEDDLQELEHHVHFNEKGKENFDEITTCTVAEMQEWLDGCETLTNSESLTSDDVEEKEEESDFEILS